jgi:hypothetical protein
VTWPGLLALIGVLVVVFWLYQRHNAAKTYGPAVIALSIATIRTPMMLVEAAVQNDGDLPKTADRANFTPIDQQVGASDRLVRLRVEMIADGELVMHYDGWQFHGATLRLTPTAADNTLRWKCDASGIPREWIEGYCKQLESRTVQAQLADPEVEKAARESRDSQDAQMTAQAAEEEARIWDAPFRSRGTLGGNSVVIAEALARLAPFQEAAQEYLNANDSLPGGTPMEQRFPEEQRHFEVMGHPVTVDFYPDAGMGVEIEGLSTERVTLSVSAYREFGKKLLRWQCRPAGGPASVEVPQECYRAE